MADQKSTKSLDNFDNKQPNFSILFIFVFQFSFFDCILSKIVGFVRFWSTLDSNPTKIGDSQQKTWYLEYAQHFLSVYCPKLSLFFTMIANCKPEKALKTGKTRLKPDGLVFAVKTSPTT